MFILHCFSPAGLYIMTYCSCQKMLRFILLVFKTFTLGRDWTLSTSKKKNPVHTPDTIGTGSEVFPIRPCSDQQSWSLRPSSARPIRGGSPELCDSLTAAPHWLPADWSRSLSSVLKSLLVVIM